MLNERDLATIQADLAGLANDVEQPITYRRYSHTTPGDPTLGIAAQDVYYDEGTTATAREFTVEEIQLSGGVYTIGDMEFGVRRPTTDNRDQIAYGSATWKIVEIRPVRLAGAVLTWRLRCKRV